MLLFLQVQWYWVLVACYMVEQMGVLFRASRITFFKSSRAPSWSDFFIVFMFETTHVIGLSLMIFVVLPELDVVRGCMVTTCSAIIPMFLSKKLNEKR